MRIPVALLGISSVACFAGSACIVQAPTQEGSQVSKPKPPPAPAQEYRIGANFGEKVELVSTLVAPGSAFVGDTVRVGLNLKVLQQIDIDYMVFVHVEDVDGRVERLNVDHAPLRGQRPTSKWQAGETLRDEFEIPIPPQMQVRGLNVLVGFWDPKTDARLPLINKDAVTHDGNNRIMAARFQVSQAP
jgi:hypothetical protein